MLWTPSAGAAKIISNAGITGSAFQTVTSGAANTYGSATELISSANNTQDSWGVSIIAAETAASAVSSSCCVDILAGDATEDVLIPSLLMGWAYGGPVRSYFFPVHVPAGTRIAARVANEAASKAIGLQVYLMGGATPRWPTGRKVTAYGTKNNSARGQSVTPAQSGAAASTTELAAATAEHHIYFLPGFEPYNDTTLQNRNYSIGIGVGSTPTQRIGTWEFGFDAGEKGSGPMPPMGVWTEVPAGTRLAMLASNSGTNDSTYGGLIYAVS